MDKVFTFLILISTVSVLLFMAGVTSSSELNIMGAIYDITNGGSIESSTLWVGILAIFGTVVGLAAVNAGTFGNASAASVIGAFAMVSTVLVTFLSDFLAVIKKMGVSCEVEAVQSLCTLGYWIIYPIFSILIVGFIWSLVEFIMGGGD